MITMAWMVVAVITNDNGVNDDEDDDDMVRVMPTIVMKMVTDIRFLRAIMMTLGLTES